MVIAGLALWFASSACAGDAPLLDFFNLPEYLFSPMGTLTRPPDPRLYAALVAGCTSLECVGCGSMQGPADLVRTVLPGRFTAAPGDLVVAGNERCGGSVAEQENRLVWLPRDQAPVALTIVGFGTAIPLPDLNGDGFNEILSIHGYSRSYAPFEATVGTLASGSWKVLQELGAVAQCNYEDTYCIYSVVTRGPGTARLRQTNYLCPLEKMPHSPAVCTVRSVDTKATEL